MQLHDILRHKEDQPVLVRQSNTISATVQLMAQRGASAVIVENDHLQPAAIFTEHDLARAIAQHGAAALDHPVGSYSSQPLISCAPDTKIETALATMTLAKIRHLPVMESGRLLGLLVLADIARQRLRDKELEVEVLLDLARRHG